MFTFSTFVSMLSIAIANDVSGSVDDFRVLRSINSLRAHHSAPPVRVSKELSAVAQSWSDHLGAYSLFTHSTLRYGEVLAIVANQNATDAIIESIHNWYQEVSLYNYTNPVYSPATGHFTQLCWYSSRIIGYGVSTWTNPMTSNSQLVVVMLFDPPGNVIGRFNSNVYPPVRVSPAPSPASLPQKPQPSPVNHPSPGQASPTNVEIIIHNIYDLDEDPNKDISYDDTELSV